MLRAVAAGEVVAAELAADSDDDCDSEDDSGRGRSRDVQRRDAAGPASAGISVSAGISTSWCDSSRDSADTSAFAVAPACAGHADASCEV